MSTGLPPFTLDRPTDPRSINVFEDEKTEVEMLVAKVINLVRSEVTRMDLLETFLGQRIVRRFRKKLWPSGSRASPDLVTIP